mmetsp:Transcript_4499/g.9285  ORF Transcript_4499/g.9285 Transcript_4499/m.9285 type:complete len:82 (+) Transcript_4499:2165-2410(+)
MLHAWAKMLWLHLNYTLIMMAFSPYFFGCFDMLRSDLICIDSTSNLQPFALFRYNEKWREEEGRRRIYSPIFLCKCVKYVR